MSLIVVINLPGYLPEAEPVPCATVEEARDYIVDWIDAEWDHRVETGMSLIDAQLEFEPLVEEARRLGVNDALFVGRYYVAIEVPEDDE